MGADMAQRLVRGGHRVIGFDPKADPRKHLEEKGAQSAASLDALVLHTVPLDGSDATRSPRRASPIAGCLRSAAGAGRGVHDLRPYATQIGLRMSSLDGPYFINRVLSAAALTSPLGLVPLPSSKREANDYAPLKPISEIDLFLAFLEARFPACMCFACPCESPLFQKRREASGLEFMSASVHRRT